MRNLLSLLVIVVVAAGVSFAQLNVADVSETGNYNTGSVYQDGYMNYVKAVTLGDWNTIDADQMGGKFPKGVQNQIYIDQIGDRNDANLYQHDKRNWIDADQFGDDNSVRIQQLRNLNWAKTIQRGDLNTIFVGQNSPWSAPNQGNTYWNRQLGDDNYTHFYQWGGFNYLYVDQVGDENRLFSFKNGNRFGGGESDGNLNSVVLYQVGNMNETALRQHGNRNTFTARQQGYWNYIRGFDGTPAPDYNSDAMQIGNRHTATLRQIGDINDIFLYQYGTGHTQTVNQVGDYNSTDVYQTN